LSVKNIVHLGESLYRVPLQHACVALAKARLQRFAYRVSQKKAPEKRFRCFVL